MRYYDAVYKDFTGNKRYCAYLYGFDCIVIAAPDKTAALVTAASYWGVRWQRLVIYDNIKIYKV